MERDPIKDPLTNDAFVSKDRTQSFIVHRRHPAKVILLTKTGSKEDVPMSVWDQIAPTNLEFVGRIER